MLATKPITYDTESMGAVVMLLAVVLVVYWRKALKLMAMALATGLIALVGFGAFTLMSSHG
jgi:hypothetical protein